MPRRRSTGKHAPHNADFPVFTHRVYASNRIGRNQVILTGDLPDIRPGLALQRTLKMSSFRSPQPRRPFEHPIALLLVDRGAIFSERCDTLCLHRGRGSGPGYYLAHCRRLCKIMSGARGAERPGRRREALSPVDALSLEGEPGSELSRYSLDSYSELSRYSLDSYAESWS